MTAGQGQRRAASFSSSSFSLFPLPSSLCRVARRPCAFHHHPPAATAVGAHQAAEFLADLAHKPLHLGDADGFDLAEAVIQLIEPHADGFFIEDGFVQVSVLGEAAIQAAVVQPLAGQHVMAAALAGLEAPEGQEIPAVHCAKIVDLCCGLPTPFLWTSVSSRSALSAVPALAARTSTKSPPRSSCASTSAARPCHGR